MTGPRRPGFRYSHFGRYGEIISVLVKYGFGDVLSRLNLERYLSVGRRLFRVKKAIPLEAISHWDRIRMALEELGPTFIKLGQFGSNRPDILPPDLIESLENLQDNVPPFAEAKAVEIIVKELKKPLEKLFQQFEHKPFASASMAQVHRATLHNGDRVAVKVQRPGITEMVAIDLGIMYHLASLIEKHMQGMEIFRPLQFVDEFAGAIRKELDFTAEAQHIDHFARNFATDPTVLIPRVYHELTTRKVITSQFIDGIKISHRKAILDAGLDPRLIASRGADIVLKQIFVDGYFHADPHPGNILVTEGNVICLLDLGMTGILTPTSRERFSAIVVGIGSQDPKKIVKTLYEISGQRLERLEDLEYELTELIQEYATRKLSSINVGEVFNRLARLMVVHRLRLIPGFYLLVKALVTMEGIGVKLDPDFNMMEHIAPFARRLASEQYSPATLAKETYETAQDFFLLLRDLPTETREILEIVKNGRMQIGFEHRGLDPMLRKFDQLVNRIVFGIVLASLVIGSSIVVLSKIPPKLYGLPIIGLAGFLAAGIMGFWLLISILRHERM